MTDARIQFWNDYVAWYQLWLNHNNYTQLLLERLLPLVKGEKTFLDIGAGTGYFALQVAPYLQQVTCVEPAKNMRHVILQEARKQQVEILCHEKTWEELSLQEIGRHDLVLAAHSFYEMQDLKQSLEKMLAATERKFFLIVRVKKKQGELFRGISADLKALGIQRKSVQEKPALADIKAILQELHYKPQIEVVVHPAGYYYHSLEQASNHWKTLLHLAEAELIGEVLQKYLIYEDHHWVLPDISQTAFVLVEKGEKR